MSGRHQYEWEAYGGPSRSAAAKPPSTIVVTKDASTRAVASILPGTACVLLVLIIIISAIWLFTVSKHNRHQSSQHHHSPQKGHHHPSHKGQHGDKSCKPPPSPPKLCIISPKSPSCKPACKPDCKPSCKPSCKPCKPSKPSKPCGGSGCSGGCPGGQPFTVNYSLECLTTDFLVPQTNPLLGAYCKQVDGPNNQQFAVVVRKDCREVFDGPSPLNQDLTGHMIVWQCCSSSWHDLGRWLGPPGEDGKEGDRGSDGKRGEDGQKGDKGDKGDPGDPFKLNGSDCIDDQFFQCTGAQPWEMWCQLHPGGNFFMLVECDTRTRAVPATLVGNMTGHLIEYNCQYKDWIDLGLLTGIQGPPGKDGCSVKLIQEHDGVVLADCDGNAVFIANGKKGKDGKKGDDGKPGCSITMTPQPNGVVLSDCRGMAVFLADGKKGKDGKPGKDGKAGKPGKDGKAGKAGDGIQWRGGWKCDGRYRRGDVVSYNNSTWIFVGSSRDNKCNCVKPPDLPETPCTPPPCSPKTPPPCSPKTPCTPPPQQPPPCSPKTPPQQPPCSPKTPPPCSPKTPPPCTPPHNPTPPCTPPHHPPTPPCTPPHNPTPPCTPPPETPCTPPQTPPCTPPPHPETPCTPPKTPCTPPKPPSPCTPPKPPSPCTPPKPPSPCTPPHKPPSPPCTPPRKPPSPPCTPPKKPTPCKHGKNDNKCGYDKCKGTKCDVPCKHSKDDNKCGYDKCKGTKCDLPPCKHGKNDPKCGYSKCQGKKKDETPCKHCKDDNKCGYSKCQGTKKDETPCKHTKDDKKCGYDKCKGTKCDDDEKPCKHTKNDNKCGYSKCAGTKCKDDDDDKPCKHTKNDDKCGYSKCAGTKCKDDDKPCKHTKNDTKCGYSKCAGTKTKPAASAKPASTVKPATTAAKPTVITAVTAAVAAVASKKDDNDDKKKPATTAPAKADDKKTATKPAASTAAKPAATTAKPAATGASKPAVEAAKPAVSTASSKKDKDDDKKSTTAKPAAAVVVVASKPAAAVASKPAAAVVSKPTASASKPASAAPAKKKGFVCKKRKGIVPPPIQTTTTTVDAKHAPGTAGGCWQLFMRGPSSSCSAPCKNGKDGKSVTVTTDSSGCVILTDAKGQQGRICSGKDCKCSGGSGGGGGGGSGNKCCSLGFRFHEVGPLTDALLNNSTTASCPYVKFCTDHPECPDARWIMVVTKDQRTNRSLPKTLKGDMTGHLLEYCCDTRSWRDVGPFTHSGSGGVNDGKCVPCVCTDVTVNFAQVTGALSTAQAYTTDNEVANVVAYGFKVKTPAAPSALYGKAGAGLGLQEDAGNQNAIDKTHFVQLDLGDVMRVRSNRCADPTVTIAGLQVGEGYAVYGSDTLGTLGIQLFQKVVSASNVSDPSNGRDTIVVPSYGTDQTSLQQFGLPYRFISVRAVGTPSGANVTVLNLKLSVCERQCPTSSSTSDGKKAWRRKSASATVATTATATVPSSSVGRGGTSNMIGGIIDPTDGQLVVRGAEWMATFLPQTQQWYVTVGETTRPDQSLVHFTASVITTVSSDTVTIDPASIEPSTHQFVSPHDVLLNVSGPLVAFSFLAILN